MKTEIALIAPNTATRVAAVALLLARYATRDEVSLIVKREDGDDAAGAAKLVYLTIEGTARAFIDQAEQALRVAVEHDAATRMCRHTLPSREDVEVVLEGETLVIHADVADTIEQIRTHVHNIIAALSGHDDTAIVATISMLGAGERAQILSYSNASSISFDDEALPNVIDLFTSHVQETPDHPALIDGERTLTYRELDDAANALCDHLITLGIAMNPRVATYLPRGADAVIAFLGILKARGTYVPIDTGYPEARVAAITESANPLVTLTPAMMKTIAVSSSSSSSSRQTPKPEDSAYIIFTSGSTGKPKGVVVNHGSLSSYAEAATHAYRVDRSDRVLQAASLGFDLSLEEMVITLTAGATLVVRSAAPIESIQSFLDECVQRELSVLSITSALWHELTMRLADKSVTLPPHVKLVILGADVARPDVLAIWQRVTASQDRDVRLVNSYGLTETTIVATVWEASRDGEPLDDTWRAVPIGRPLKNASAYVLDANNALQPIGIAGEVCIGGPAVASHYLDDDALTASKFVADPFLPGRRMYRTGDRGILRANGDFEFLGRADYQIKVNGVRIELGEIESRIREYPGVVEGIVIARKNHAGETELEAHVMTTLSTSSTTSTASASELRTYLETVIPLATVPARIHLVDRFPLTPAGKIDRRALSATTIATTRAIYAPPTTALEKLVVSTMVDVLRLTDSNIGMLDGFGALGGTSLSAVRAASVLGNRLNRRVRAQVFLEAKTLRDACAALAEPEKVLSLLPAIFTQDAVLTASIVPPLRASHSPATLSTVFLTGATGFYGTFVLDDLLRHTQANVICLVRAPSPAQGRERILATLRRRSCDVDIAMFDARVTIALGDLGLPNLGLDDVMFARLCESVTTIFHIGANVNMMLPYEALRASNVMAVESVLRLATTGRSKTVHHVSTVEVLSDMDPSTPDALSERRTASSPLRLHDGYGQSKWVAEKLVEGARARGIRAYIHRPGRLLGHSRTGAFNADDFLMRMLEACGRIGAVPVLDVAVDMTPVDYASHALVQLAKRDPEFLDRTEAFHLVHPETISWMALVDRIVDLGYPLRLVSHEDWCTRLHGDAEGDFSLYLAGMSKVETEASLHGGYASSATRAALGQGFTFPSDSHSHLLATYLATLADAGRFPDRRQ